VIELTGRERELMGKYQTKMVPWTMLQIFFLTMQIPLGKISLDKVGLGNISFGPIRLLIRKKGSGSIFASLLSKRMHVSTQGVVVRLFDVTTVHPSNSYVYITYMMTPLKS
jgi:hypothetical protein